MSFPRLLLMFFLVSNGISCRLDLNNIRLVSKLGGTVDDSELIDGMVFDQKAAKAASGPGKVANAKIALIQFCVSPPKTDLENNVVVSDYTAMDRILKVSGACPFALPVVCASLAAKPC